MGEYVHLFAHIHTNVHTTQSNRSISALRIYLQLSRLALPTLRPICFPCNTFFVPSVKHARITSFIGTFAVCILTLGAVLQSCNFWLITMRLRKESFQNLRKGEQKRRRIREEKKRRRRWWRRKNEWNEIDAEMWRGKKTANREQEKNANNIKKLFSSSLFRLHDPWRKEKGKTSEEEKLN